MDANELGRALAFDTPRVWATQVSVFPGNENGDTALLVFRETATVLQEAPEGEDAPPPETLGRNVTSIVMPTSVIRELGELIGTTFPPLAETKAK